MIYKYRYVFGFIVAGALMPLFNYFTNILYIKGDEFLGFLDAIAFLSKQNSPFLMVILIMNYFIKPLFVVFLSVFIIEILYSNKQLK